MLDDVVRWLAGRAFVRTVVRLWPDGRWAEVALILFVVVCAGLIAYVAS